MNLIEYNKIKNFSYLEYCDYLQNKYGTAKYDFFTPSFNKNRNITRTKEGLVSHHKYEDHMIMLSTLEIAKEYPFEWQRKENIIYCDYLEHLFLHILICEYPSPDKEPLARVGYGGVVNFIGPELNDLYSGWQTKQGWRKTCHDLVRNDSEVYFVLLERFISKQNDIELSELTKSFNDSFGTWDETNNQKIYKKIEKIYCKYHGDRKIEFQEDYKRKANELLTEYDNNNISAANVIDEIDGINKAIYEHGYFECNIDIDDYSVDEVVYFPFGNSKEEQSFNERLYELINEKEDYKDLRVCKWCVEHFGDYAAARIPEQYFNIEWGYHLVDKYINKIPKGTNMKQLYDYYVSKKRSFKINKIPEEYRNKNVYLKYLLNSSTSKVFFKRYEEIPDKYINNDLFKKIIKETNFKVVRDYFLEKLN